MTGIVSNALAIARRIEAKVRALEHAVTRGLRRLAITVEREQIKRLSGSNGAASGAYPVPNRTGHLTRESFFDVRDERFALVGNRATYALTVHEGEGSSRKFGRRPFLEDAVLAADSGEIMAAEIRKALEAA